MNMLDVMVAIEVSSDSTTLICLIIRRRTQSELIALADSVMSWQSYWLVSGGVTV
jgi:hypothetical protein